MRYYGPYYIAQLAKRHGRVILQAYDSSLVTYSWLILVDNFDLKCNRPWNALRCISFLPDNKCCWALECWSKSWGWDFSRFKWFTICWWQFKLVSNFSLILIQPLNTIPAIFYHNLSFALYNLPVFFLFIFSMLSYKAVCCQILSRFVCAQKQLNVVPVPSTQMYL